MSVKVTGLFYFTYVFEFFDRNIGAEINDIRSFYFKQIIHIQQSEFMIFSIGYRCGQAIIRVVGEGCR